MTCHVVGGSSRRKRHLRLLKPLLLFCGGSGQTTFGFEPFFAHSKVSRRQPSSRNKFAISESYIRTFSASRDDEMMGEGTSSPDPVASRDALDALVPRQKIISLSTRSTTKGILQVCFHFGMFGLAAVAIRNNALSLFAMAFVSSFYFCGLHECVHRTAFQPKWLNDLFAHVFGFLTFRPAIHYRHYHWQHHMHTGNPRLDSELQAGSLLDVPVDTPLTYLWYLSGIPFWMDAFMSLLRHSFARNYSEIYLKTDKKCRQVKTEARVYLAMYSTVAISAWAAKRAAIQLALVWFWILPALLGQPFLRFYLLAEHRGRKESPNIMENTRTIAHTNSFYRKLAWQMPYHTEHHAWPSVPFWRLQEVHKMLMQAGGNQIMDVGEENPELRAGNGRKGYIDFNWKFWKMLVCKSTNS